MADHTFKHPIFNHAADIAQICSPLQKLNITYFGHIKINSSGELAAMANNPEFANHYFKNKYFNADIHLSDKNFGQYVVWDAIERTKLSAKMHKEAAAFGVQHTFTIINKTKNSTDYYHFANNSSDKTINQFYITHIELLKSFILHFNDKVHHNHALKSAYDITFSIDKNAPGYSIKNSEKAIISQNKISEFLNSISVNGNSTIDKSVLLIQQESSALIHRHTNLPILLTQQQYKCLVLLVSGKSIKRIAQAINLSPRTVEHYLVAVRKILCCSTNKEMISVYYPQVYPLLFDYNFMIG